MIYRVFSFGKPSNLFVKELKINRLHMREPLGELEQKKSKFAKRLLAWYAVHRRNFPWRRSQDPFKILLAEAMLRKTTARQVAKLYQRFLLKYPNPSSLLSAPLKGLMDWPSK
jgi:adenine-specific DNA glycosylase